MAKEKKFSDYRSPFRVGRRKKRAVLDSRGHEVIVFQKGQEQMATELVDLLNKNILYLYQHRNDI